MSTDKTMGDSMVCRDKVTTKNKGGGIGIGEGDGKSDLLEDSIAAGNQRFADSVERIYVKTGFTLEVTPKKSGVEDGWDLASPYVVHPCLHTQWSHISRLVRGEIKTCHEV